MTPDVPQSTFGTKQRDALDAAFQAKDTDLTTIAGLTATTDNFMQAKASAWASRTPAQAAIDLLPYIYPIGSLYFSVNSTNPATSLGFGTWSAFGAGKMMVGFDGADTDFDTDEETGGAKTYTLTTANLPAGSLTNESGINNRNTAGAATLKIASGAATAIDTVPPYIVVRAWKRTA